jgi:Flp pilus assembly pilin Flp
MQASGLLKWRGALSAWLLRSDAVRARVRTAEVGQSMVEYSIVAALIAVAAMVAVQALGGGIAQVFTNILTRISSIG